MSRGEKGLQLRGARDWVTVGVDQALLHQHQLLVTGRLELQTNTQLGGVLGVVNLTREQDRNSWQDSLLHEDADLTEGVQLASEDRLAVLVLGTDGGLTFNNRLVTDWGTHQRVGDWLNGGHQLGLQTGLDLVGDLSPEGTNKGTLSLDLCGGDPLAGVVTGKVADSRVRRDRHGLSGVHGLQTNGELRSQRLQQGGNGNTRETAVQQGWIQGLEVNREVVGVVVLLQLAHDWLAVGNLQGDLQDVVLVPAVVDFSAEREVVIDVTLDKEVLLSVQGTEGIWWQSIRAHGQGVGGLESWVQRKRLVQVGTQTGEKVLTEEDITVHLLGDILDGAWVDQTQRFSVFGDVHVDIVQVREHWVRRPQAVLLRELGRQRRECGDRDLRDLVQLLLVRHLCW